MKFELVSNRSFQHPPHTCPMIFICSGTGFAPIRGLLQKRVYFHNRGEKLGPAYIVFGSRSSNEGTFFQEEIKDFQENGALTEAFLCYSREPGQKKEYTTDKLRTKECEDILGPLLGEKDTHIFLCGSANMAEECKSAFREMSSPSCFDAIENEHRIHCDVFGALSSANTRKKIGVTRKQTRSRRRSIGSFVMSSENKLLLGLQGTRKSK